MKGCVFEQKVYYSMTILENFRRYAPFLSDFVHKMVHMLAEFAKKTAYFSPKNCNRKDVFSQKIAIERVWFRRLRWHNRVQKLLFRQLPPPGNGGAVIKSYDLNRIHNPCDRGSHLLQKKQSPKINYWPLGPPGGSKNFRKSLFWPKVLKGTDFAHNVSNNAENVQITPKVCVV